MLMLVLVGFAITNLVLLVRLWLRMRRAGRAHWRQLDSLKVVRRPSLEQPEER